MSFSGIPESSEGQPVVIMNDGFWPDFDVTHFQKVYRLPAEYAQELLQEQVTLAMAWANIQLAEWKHAKQAAGAATFAAVPANEQGGTVGGETVLALQYRRAVSCYAKAVLLDEFKTISRREAARNEAKESEDTHDGYLARANKAVADFLGKSVGDVELL